MIDLDIFISIWLRSDHRPQRGIKSLKSQPFGSVFRQKLSIVVSAFQEGRPLRTKSDEISNTLLSISWHDQEMADFQFIIFQRINDMRNSKMANMLEEK
jgi:hypothetical protein